MLTPFKSFSRRRNYLIYMLSHKFDHLWSEEEKSNLLQIEKKQFNISTSLKAFSVLLLMHLRFYKRPIGRPITFDLGLIYFGLYAFLGSNIPGVFMTWQDYEKLALRMAEHQKTKKRKARHGTEFLDETNLPDYKAFYYRYDITLTRFY